MKKKKKTKPKHPKCVKQTEKSNRAKQQIEETGPKQNTTRPKDNCNSRTPAYRKNNLTFLLFLLSQYKKPKLAQNSRADELRKTKL